MSSEIYKIDLSWIPADKNFNYAEYSRDYKITSEGKPSFIASSPTSYKGNSALYNPEDLLIVSLSGCFMLSYLAVAAHSKLEVLAYEDHADGSLEKFGISFKFKEVTLHPKITMKSGTDEEKALSVIKKAHETCFIANSVNFPVHVLPEIVVK